MSYVSDPSLGTATALNITASTVLKTGPGIIGTVIVSTAPTSGGIYDSASIGGATAATLIVALPTTGVPAVLALRFQVQAGITVVLAGAGVVSVSYS